MDVFFSCFSCGEKSNVVNPAPIQVVMIKESKDSLGEIEDNKSRSNTSITFITSDTAPSQSQDDIRRKVQHLRKKDLPQRKAMESQFVRQNLARSQTVYLVEKQWSEGYTAFLKSMDQTEMRSINNSRLLDANGTLLSTVKEREHYFIINQRIWQFLQMMYGGGPGIARDIYFPVNLIVYRKQEVTMSGITNPLNLCFMISVLQCLFSVGQLNHYFFRKLYVDSQDTRKKTLHQQFHKLLKQLTELPGKQDIKEFASYFEKRFNPNQQHDAHEFILFALGALQEECKQEIAIENKEIKDAESAYSLYFANNKCIIDKIFIGLMETVVHCNKCSTPSLTFVPFLELSIQINEDTLEDCLRKHFSSQKLDDLYDCRKCERKTKASKQYYIAKTPYILTILLKKFSIDNKKIEDRVQYSLELDLKKICKGHCGDTRYQLQSVLVHKGSRSTKGHYYVYTRRQQNKWYYANDELTKEMNLPEVLGRDAYMLFYERIK